MPRPRTTGNNMGGVNDTSRHLASFAQNLRLANREAGASWRLQQQENQAREGLITSLAKYRARSAALTAVIGGASAIGTGMSDAVKFGGGDTAGGMIRSDSVRFAAMNLMADHFDFGGIFSQVQTPIRRAGERTADITSKIAMAGGKVSPELRGALKDIFLPAEKRAEDERREVAKLFTGKETLGEAMQGTKFGEAVDKLSKTLDSLMKFLDRIKLP